MPREMTLGGALWINLANTIMKQSGNLTDGLDDPEYTIRWLEANGLLADRHAAERVLSAVLPALVQLRDICADAIADLMREGRLSEPTLARIGDISRHLAVDVRMERRHGGFQLIHEARNPADRVRYAVLRSLADTLARYAPDRIRKCGHEACMLHFVDTSKSGKRRWCSMELCGNRRKAAEFYARQKLRSDG